MLRIFFVVLALIYVDKCVGSDETHENGFCYKLDSGVECIKPRETTLTRLEGGEVGAVEAVEVENDRKLFRKIVCNKPLVFEIQDFLTDEECDHFINVAKETGLKSSHTESQGNKGLQLMDLDSDQRLSIDEMKITIENGFDMYLEEDDILQMYADLKIDPNNDRYVERKELKPLNPSRLTQYLRDFIEKHPEKHSRFSKQAWLFPDKSSDKVFRAVQERVSKVVQLPMSLISLSDFQVVNYGVKGHYNAHLDSSKVEPNLPCCDRGRLKNCRICRYMTVLFYLNEVGKGGETAFPVANNETLDVGLIHRQGMGNLYKKCEEANLRVSAQKRKAVLWYNHLVDPSTGWMGDIDLYTFHGGCPVTQGEKWIANFWIKTTNNKAVDMERMKKASTTL